nr:hypothetical protein Q903MT_gene3461 [Picea sitchensis]
MIQHQHHQWFQSMKQMVILLIVRKTILLMHPSITKLSHTKLSHTFYY